MAIKRYPPAYSETKKYPPQYDLDKIDVYLDAPPGDYFNISGLPEEVGFGKHAFTIYITEPDGQTPLKDYGSVLIEAKDADGNLIFSGITDSTDVGGASVCYVWIKKDPLRTTKTIVDGVGTLTIAGQLSNVPAQYKDVYNLRTSFPLNIRKSYPNVSPILLQSSSLVQNNITITEQLEADIDNVNFNRSYAAITLKKLKTYSGQIDNIQISYLESGSLSGLTEDDYTLLTQQAVQGTSASFEDDIDHRIADGLNPISQSFKVLMPAMANQSGSNFGLDDNKFKFKFEFLNKNNEKAKIISTNEDLIITSSYISFAGPATVITGEDNLIAGQMYIGNSVGQGIEVSAQNSAFLRSIGYLGFTSASAGSGSGFMLYSGSVLQANTDDYSQGGVGFEFVSSSEAYMKFNSNPGIFDVRAKSFFVGSEATQFISGSGNNIEISASGFHLTPEGNVTMSGQLAVDAGGTIGGFTIGTTALSTNAFILSSSQNTSDPVSFISSSAFKVSAGGGVSASSMYIDGAFITGSTDLDVKTIRAAGVNIGGAGDTADGQISTTQITASIISASSLISASEAYIPSLTAPEITFTSALSGSAPASLKTTFTANHISGSDGGYFGDDVNVFGNVTADTFTTVEIGSDFSSGNTTFGNTMDDKHRFTGSILLGTSSIDNVYTTGKYISGSSITTGSFIKATIGTAKPAVGQALTVQGNISGSGTGSFDGGGYFGSKVGIGTTSPDNALHISYDSSAGEGSVQNNTGAVGLQIENTNADGVAAIHLRSSDSDGYIMYDDSGANKGDFYFKTDGGDSLAVLTLLDGGNVGIGTESPGEKLEVVGNISSSGNGSFGGTLNVDGASTFTGVVDAYKTSFPQIRLSDDSGTDITSLGQSSEVFYFKTSDTSNDFQFRRSDNVDLMRLDMSALRVGINTTSPTRDLHISSSGVTRVAIDGKGGSNARLHFNDGGTDTWNIGNNASDSTFNIYDSVNSKTPFKVYQGTTNNILIISGGNVGIRTTAPTVPLQVTGDISSSGNIKGDTFTATGNVDFNGDLDVDGTTNLDVVDIDGNVDLDGNLVVGSGNISSPTFFSGFAGSGFQISTGSVDNEGKTSMTIDNLTVRNQMSVYELLIHQIRATNGSLFVSNTGKVISASLEDGSKQYKLFFDTGSGYGHSFRPGDLIRAQRFQPDANGSGSTDGTATYKSDLMIISCTDTTSSIAELTGSTDTDAPGIGYEYVRIGNTSTGSRQGSIYLTADDAHAPYIDVVDDVTTHAGFGAAGKVKLRMGKLSGINSDTFGQLGSGLHKYGFYASGSAFLEGGINATRGTIGNWSIGFNKISSSNIVIDAANQIISLGNTTFGNSGVQLKYDGNGQLHAGSSTSKFIKFDGTDVTIKSPNFELDSGGNITASDGIFAGKVTAGTGSIGGFGLNTTAISSSKFVLSASAGASELFISHSTFKVRNDGQITASALLLTGSSGTNFLLYNNGTLTVRGDVAATTISTPSASINADGYITATSGSIGGFTISDDEIKAHQITLNSAASDNGKILLGSATAIGSGTGVYLDGNGKFRAGKVNGERIRFDSDTLLLSSSKFLIGSDEQFISGSNGKLQIRAQDAIISGSDIKILTPSFLLGDVSSSISGGNGTINISGSNIELQTPNFVLGSPSTYISGSTSGIQISGSNVELLTKDFFLGSKEKFISGSGTGLEISSSGFHLSKEGRLILSGTISASAGDIGGWRIAQEKLSTSGFEIASSGYILSSSNFKVDSSGDLTGSSALLDGGQIGGFVLTTNQLSASGVVLKTAGRGTGGEITASAGLIGGFTLTTESIAIGNIKLSSEEKGLIISSSAGSGKLKVASGSLSTTVGTAENLFLNSGFESDDSGDTGNDVLYWGVNSSTIDVNSNNNFFLWHSGSISVNVTASSGQSAAGSKHFEIFVPREDQPLGGGAVAGGSSGGGSD